MFASISRRFRRHVAILSAFALMASVLAAAPAVAADDPSPSLEADYSACEGVDSVGFEDVPANHSSAGSIGCIAYYGITMGTSATTYSPSMSVTREHMALFLIRLAGKIGIEVAANPDDAGFTDIGELSAESQTAINQLADLGVTQGTSDTTYSPADAVKRGHMALFIARLMDKMTPIGGGDSAWGHTPSDVDDLDKDDVGSPFTDLGSVTKETYDAITALYELDVASGFSDTAYAPDASITRAAMADFMAGVMDHSNLRPAGVSIQAAPDSGYGHTVMSTVIISVRDDSFAPVMDQAVDYFNSEAANGGLDQGECITDAVTGDCTWSESDEFTLEDGNLVLTEITVTNGATNLYYAWIGDDDGDEFDANEVDYDTASVTSMKDEQALKVTSTINEEARSSETAGRDVDLDRVDSVTITVQLVDTANSGDSGPADNAKAVARSGQKINVGVSQSSDTNGDGDSSDDGEGSVFSSSRVATLTTDEDGKVTYMVEGPDDNHTGDVQIGDDVDGTPATEAAGLEDRLDVITFTYDDGNDGSPAVNTVTYRIRWSELNSVTTKAEASTMPFVIRESDGDAKVSATVTIYDQYGNGYRQASGQQVGISFTGETDNPVANVNGNGVARRGITLEDQSAGIPITVTYTINPTETPTDINPVITTVAGPTTIQVVVEADDDSTDAGSKNVHTLFADDNQFTTESATPANADTLYSYSSDDTFLMGGSDIGIDKFEELLAQAAGTANDAVVNVVLYNPDGASIFEVTQDSDPDN
ncbi:MAG: S-layer homology domain-containing protein [Chloroflexi bacterium]|nr:S-layer homology domain-containing protein [Chloroflexota bacterium]